MKVRSFKRINFDDPEINRFQENIGATVGDIQQCPFLRGNTFSSIEVTNAADGVKIAHGLPELPLGYAITSKYGPGDIWLVSKSPRYLVLKASVSSVTIDLWVY